MSRTKRNLPKNWYRNMAHLSERRALTGLLTDSYVEDYPISGINRMRKRLGQLPQEWDDMPVAAYSEQYKA